ncbi:hypothetical protein NCC49_000695 [Naganishia albida]|nr:hypothetical protein NCC49_000695 [Naganishia albida]
MQAIRGDLALLRGQRAILTVGYLKYRDALSSKSELDHEVIDLQAPMRDKDGIQNGVTHGKRMYQTTSHEDMKSWIYAVCNAVESSINGTNTLSRARPSTGLSLLPPHSPTSFSSHQSAGLGLDAIRVVMPRSRSSLRLPGLGIGFLGPSSRQSSRSSKASKRSSLVSTGDEGALGTVLEPPSCLVDPVPFPTLRRQGSDYQLELDDDMKNAVLSVNPMVVSPTAIAQPVVLDQPDLVPSETMTQERFRHALADVPRSSVPVDMAMLRQSANLPTNQTCSDCGHPIKGENSQRWATISIITTLRSCSSAFGRSPGTAGPSTTKQHASSTSKPVKRRKSGSALKNNTNRSFGASNAPLVISDDEDAEQRGTMAITANVQAKEERKEETRPQECVMDISDDDMTCVTAV